MFALRRDAKGIVSFGELVLSQGPVGIRMIWTIQKMNPYVPDVLGAFFVRGVRIWLC